MTGILDRLLYPARVPVPESRADADIDALIGASSLAEVGATEEAFVQRALSLGVEAGVLLDVGSGPGLIPLKILCNNENFYGIGVDVSEPAIERAREIAQAWELSEKAFFQIGSPRGLRFKTGYFDLVVSHLALHRFPDPVQALREMDRVVKPTGAILIQDLRRSGRIPFRGPVRFTGRMREMHESAIRAAYTPGEVRRMLDEAGIRRVELTATRTLITIERRGATDEQSWVRERDRYL